MRNDQKTEEMLSIFLTPHSQKRPMKARFCSKWLSNKDKNPHCFFWRKNCLSFLSSICCPKGATMKTQISQFLAVAVLTAVAATSAQAGFVGRELKATYFVPDLATPYGSATATPATFTVGIAPAVETTVNVEKVTQIAVDFTDNSLRFDFKTTLETPTWNSASFNGMVFDLLTGSAFSLTSKSIDSSSTFTGFDASRVAFTDNQLTIDWKGLSYVNGTSLLINFTSAPASVPEPGSLALLGLALAGLAYCTRQKRSAKAVSSTHF